jgi:hypothetical protein
MAFTLEDLIEEKKRRAQGAPSAPENFREMLLEEKNKRTQQRNLDDAQMQRQVQTGVESFGQGVSLGYLPQIQAGLETGIEKGLSYIPGTAPYEARQADEEIANTGGQVIDPSASYVGKRDENIARQQAQAEEFPKTAMGAEITGGIMGAAVGGSGFGQLARGTKLAPLIAPATRVGRVGKSVAGAATYGALQNPGDIEGEISPIQPMDRLEGAAISGLVGSGFQGGVELAGVAKNIAPKVARKLKNVFSKNSVAAKSIQEGTDDPHIMRKVYQNTKKSIQKQFAPVRADDFEDSLKILKENDIDTKYIPGGLEFGEDTSIGSLEKVIRQGPGGDESASAFANFLGKINNKIKDKVANISNTGKLDSYSAGKDLVDGYNKGVKSFFKDLDITYKNFNQISPDHVMQKKTLSSLATVLYRAKREATRKLKFGTPEQKAAAKSTIEFVEGLFDMDGSYREYIEVMQDIGSQAYEKGQPILGIAPVKKKLMVQIYKVMSGNANREVGTIDKGLAKALRDNNEKISKFLGDNARVSKLIGSGKSPEKIFDSAIKNGNIDDLRALKEVVDDRTFNNVKASYLNTLIKTNDYGISYKKTLNNFRSKADILNELFGDSKEYQNIINLLGVGRKSGDAILNFSGTDRSSEFRDFLKKAISAGQDEVTVTVLKRSARKRTAKKLLKKTVGKKPKVPRKPMNTTPVGSGIGGMLSRERNDRR